MSFYGYYGLSRFPHHPSENSSFYMVTDQDRRTLNVFITTPGTENEIIEIGNHICYQNINLFFPCIDGMFFSSAVNLVEAFRLTKTVLVVHPTDLFKESNAELTMRYQRVLRYISPTSDVTVEYIPIQEITDLNVFNIKITTNEKTVFLATYLTQELIDTLYADEAINEIHIPYRKTLYGGTCFDQLYVTPSNRRYLDKLHVCHFSNRTEYEFAKRIPNIQIGPVNYSDF